MISLADQSRLALFEQLLTQSKSQRGWAQHGGSAGYRRCDRRSPYLRGAAAVGNIADALEQVFILRGERMIPYRVP